MGREAFLADIAALCRKHGISLAHEDRQGAFTLQPFSEDALEWLMVADFERQAAPRDPALERAAAMIGDAIG